MKAFDAFAETNYKNLIRNRFKELRSSKPSLTLKRIAERVPMQYTYLSKALNDEKTHLNEDHLYAVCDCLELHSDETDFAFLLRSVAITQNENRKNILLDKLERIRKARRLRASIQEFSALELQKEMEYLFDPYCVLVHVALHIDRFRKIPKLLEAALGISSKKLQQCLKSLEKMNFIESDKQEIKKVLQAHVHYDTHHPLMRVHQNLLRSFFQSQLLKTTESDHHGFQVSFSADPATFEKIKNEFKVFIQQVEKLVVPATNSHAYHLNFDLVKWL